jgi:hypothetical protein
MNQHELIARPQSSYTRRAVFPTLQIHVRLLSATVIVAGMLAGPVLVPADASAQGRKKISFDTDDEESLDDYTVEGYVHKPEVGYIITRQEQEDLETLALKESFVPKIVQSVEKRPF